MMRHVSVVIPALNEQDTVAGVVAAALADHPGEVLVIDSDSQDATASRAERAGARVVHWTRDVLPQVAPWSGKGEALWRGVAAASGEVVVFMDADLKDPRPGMVAALAAPFADPRVAMVRARYQRRLNGVVGEGGRVTELTARPCSARCFPSSHTLANRWAANTRCAPALPVSCPSSRAMGLRLDCLSTSPGPTRRQPSPRWTWGCGPTGTARWPSCGGPPTTWRVHYCSVQGLQACKYGNARHCHV